jgi:hypothetical protein
MINIYHDDLSDYSKISEVLPEKVPVTCPILHNYLKKSKKCHFYTS